MAIKQETCYIAGCDGCGILFEADYVPHYPTPVGAISNATDCGWVVVGDKLLYCETCAEGKGFPCTDCDNLVERAGENCVICQHEEKGSINAPS